MILNQRQVKCLPFSSVPPAVRRQSLAPRRSHARRLFTDCLIAMTLTITAAFATTPPTVVPTPPSTAAAPTPPAAATPNERSSTELIITVRKRQSPGGEDAVVAGAKVRLVGSEDSSGEETDSRGVLRIPMPTESKIGLQVMVAGLPTCVVKNVQISPRQARLTVLIEVKGTGCITTVRNN